MNLAQARRQWPHLNDYTDQELLDIAAQQNRIAPGTPQYERLQRDFLGYDRTWGEAGTDTLVQLGQGALGLGRMVASGFGSYDNPVSQRLGGFSEQLEQQKSQGLQNMQAGAQVRSDIAARESAARGDDSLGRFLSEAGAQVQNYWYAPGLLAQDIVTNAPQLVAGGVVGRGISLGARGLGAGAQTATRAGVAGGVGTSAGLQGADVGIDTYERAIRAGASHEEATQLANDAAARAALVSAGLSLVPGGAAIERSIVGGATTRSLGLGRLGTTARIAGTEVATEAGEEGYGQYAGNRAVQRIDPSVDLMEGVGQAAVQGGAAAGPIATFAGAAHSIRQPRTPTGEVDLVAPPINEDTDGNVTVRWSDSMDAPTAVRRGLDPLNERSSPWTPPAPTQPQAPAPMMVDSQGVVMPWQTPEQLAAMDASRAAQAPQPSMVDIAGPTYERVPPNFVSLVEPDTLPPNPYDAFNPPEPAPAAEQPAAPDIRAAVREASQEIKPGYLKKDGDLTKTAEAIMAPFLKAGDPVQALRDAHMDGAHPRDELLDNIHRILTGQTVFEWRESLTPETAPAAQAPAPQSATPPASETVAPAELPAPTLNTVDAQPGQGTVDSEPTPKKTKPPRYGRKSTAELVEIAETTKDQTELTEARYEMYKRWAEDKDDGASEAYLTDTANRSALTDEETASFQARYASELEAKAAKRGGKIGKKFGATRRRAGEVKGSPMSADRVRAALDEIKRTTPAASVVEVLDSPSDIGLNDVDGMVTLGATTPDGRVALFANAMTSPLDVARTVFHELFHRGLRASVPPREYVRLMLNLANQDPRVRQYANEWKASADGRETRNEMSEDGPLTGDRLALFEAHAVDEALARIGEELGAEGQVGTRIPQPTIRRIAQWLSNVADALGLRSLAQWVRRQTYNEQEKFVLDTIGRAGDTTPPGGSPRFSRAAAAQPPTLQPLSAATKISAAVSANVSGREISPAILKAMTLRQIEQTFGRKLPALSEWIGAIFERSSHADRLAARADRVALKWERNVPDKAEREALADVLLRASVDELALDNTSPEYLASLEPARRAQHAALRAKLAGLSQAAKDARKEALQVLREQWEYTRKSLVSFINHTISDPDLRRQRIADLNQEMGRNRGDYFPLSRFGDRVVIGRGAAPDGRDVVSFHESAASMEAEVSRLRAAGVRDKDIIKTMRTERDPRQRASTGFMAELHHEIDKADMDPAVRESMHEALQQLYLKSLPELSGAKHMIRREGIEGFSTDALRVFADAVTRGARYASHLDYGPRIQAAMESAEGQTRSSDRRTASVVIGRKDGQAPVVRVVPTGTARFNETDKLINEGYSISWFNTEPDTASERLAAQLEGATPEQIDQYLNQIKDVVGRVDEGVEDLRAAKALYNHMVGLQKSEALEDPNKLVEVMGQVGYTWYLGFTPAFWMMNILQNPMIGVPHLGAKYGVGRASAEWGKAMRWFGKVRMGKLLADAKTPFSVEWLREQKIPGLTKGELDMLQRLEDRQILDFTQAMDLSRIGSASAGKWNKFMRLAAAGAHHTEVFNRVSFALAAYRLALKSSGDVTHEQAMRRAEDDVAAVHFDYSYHNKPEMMRGRYTRLLFMFQQYRQHMLYWWARTFKEAIRNEAPGDRALALKAAGLMAVTQGLFAGALGLPFIGSLAFVLNLLAPDDDDGAPFDFERWLTDAAKEATGSEKAGMVLSKGIFAALGMNISQRIGQADLLPFINEQGSTRFERNADDKTRAFLADLLGPLGSIAVTASRSTEAFARGDTLAGLALTTPKAVSDLIKTYQLGSEGVRVGRDVVPGSREQFDAFDLLYQGTGVAPVRAANIRADRGRVIELDTALKDRVSRLTGRFTEAWLREDAEAVAEAVADIQAYNQRIAGGKLADRSLMIDGRKLERAIRDRQQRALLLALTSGTADSRRQLLLALRMSGLISAVTPETIRENAEALPGLPGLPGLD